MGRACSKIQSEKQIKILRNKITIANQYYKVALISSSLFYNSLARLINRAKKQNNIRFEFHQFINQNAKNNVHLIGQTTMNVNQLQQIERKLIEMYNNQKIFFICNSQQTNEKTINDNKIQTFLQKFKQFKIQVKEVNICCTQIEQFISQFPFMVHNNKNIQLLSKYYLPLIVFDSQDIKRANKQFKIFIHSDVIFEYNIRNNITFYQEFFQINKIIVINSERMKFTQHLYSIDQNMVFVFHNNIFEQTVQLFYQCYQNNLNVLLVHGQKLQQEHCNKISELITHFLTRIGIQYTQIINYLQEQIVDIFKKKENKTQKSEKHKIQQNTNQQIEKILKEGGSLSSDEITKQIINFHKKLTDKRMLMRSLETIKLLLAQIIKNPDQQKYRMIKKSNQRIKEEILNYEAGRALLKIIGFIEHKEQKDVLINVHDIPTLKIILSNYNLALSNIDNLLKNYI